MCNRRRRAGHVHGPSQRSPAPIPDMQRPPRDRIALNGEPLLPKQLQGVEARRVKTRCHEASEDSSCTRGRPQASETSPRRLERQRRAHERDVVLTCAPQGGQPGLVRWQLSKLLSCSRQPSQPRHGLLLQGRRGSAAARPFRRARSARAARRPRSHVDAFVLLRFAELCKCLG